MKKLLLSFAHPDDETFSCGATISKYSHLGWDIRLICATLGEAGSPGPYKQLSGNAVGAVRKEELAQAAAIMGIREIVHLGYRDQHLAGIEPGELEDVLFKKMVEFAPDIVITFDPSGITNHPDHIRISFSTTYAFQKYAEEIATTREFVIRVNREDAKVKKRLFAVKHRVALASESFTDAVGEKGVPKLYYTVLPESMVSYLIKSGAFPAESFGKPFRGVPDKKITTVIDGTRFFPKKLRALRAYVSQSGDVERYLQAVSDGKRHQEFFVLRMVGRQEVYMDESDRIADRL